MTVHGQNFQRFDYLPVNINGNKLHYPWTGGLGAMIFGKADVNNDGIVDLVSYDKTNKKYAIFLANSNNSIDYSFERKYADYFPAINGWMDIKDYNCDGIVDFFTESDPGTLKVYTGYYQNDTLRFKLQQNGFFYNNGVNVYAVDVLKPAIADFNKDGDLDVIGFNVSGNRLIYYENQQRELSLSCDSLYFKKVDNCWGNVRDTFASTYALRDTCDFKFGLRTMEILHTGSTIDAIDVDNNGAMDLIIGSVTINHVSVLYNFGSTTYASVLKQDITYPTYNIPYDVASFAAPYFLDINNDGKKDLIVSNFDANTSNVNNIWYYKNVSNDSIQLALQQKNFLLENTIDVGSYSNPCIFDVDGDGLKDLLIGNGGFVNNNDISYKLQFYKNIGTSNFPKYDLINDDYLNISSLNIKDIMPAVGDIDNDDDTDIIIGMSDGRMIYWTNTAGAGNIPVFTYSGVLKDDANTFINVGSNATPFLVDIDRDGITDLIIGERNGNINFYKGNDDISAKFSFVTDSLGKIRVRITGNNFGFSQPIIKDINNDNKYDLVLGTNFNGLLFYNNIEDSINNRILSSSPIISEQLGYRTTSTIDDITNDGKWEIITGNISGGLIIFSQDPPPFQPSIINNNFTDKLKVDIYPNPANTAVFIHLDGIKNNISLQILNTLGQEIVRKQYLQTQTITLPTSTLSTGIYIIKISDGDKESIQKLVIEH